MCPVTSFIAKLIVSMSILTVVSAGCPVKCHCTRYKTFCTLANLNTLPSVLQNTTEFLRIEADYITEIKSNIITDSGLQNLTQLVLLNVHLWDIQPGAFQNMSQLEYIAVTHNTIRALRANSFKYLQNLYFLNLSKNDISYLEPGTFSGLSNLRHMDLHNNLIKFLTANVFGGMKTINNCGLKNVPLISEILLKSSYPHSEPEIFNHICSLTNFAVGTFYVQHIPHHFSVGLSLSKISPHTIIYKRIKLGLSEVLYLDLTHKNISQLSVGGFQNLKELIYLDISDNCIKEILSGAFEGLNKLRLLKVNKNAISYLNNETFRGLDTLKWLEIVDCKITIIEINAFKGLSKLQVLDISGNLIDILKNKTFSGLRMLKELKLERNKFKHIDTTAFSDLINLKGLTNTYTLPYFGIYRTKYENAYTSRFVINDYSSLLMRSNLKLIKTGKEIFLNMERLDSLELIATTSLPKDIQVLKSIHIYLDATSVNPQQQLHDVLQTVHYVKELSITLLEVNLTQIFPILSQFEISSLILLYSDFKFLSNSSLINFLKLKSLTIYNNSFSIRKEEFCEMKSLTEFTLFYKSDLQLEEHCFYGFHNLKRLNIFSLLKLQYLLRLPAKFRGYMSANCLHKETFLGLHNLKILELGANLFICLDPGTFQGLYNIEEIYLDHNYIETINSGVFGAECKKEFKLSCKNVTLPEYCLNTNALTTLKYLNLAYNNITHIHPHAFVACDNLHTLDLKYNRFLTLDSLFLFTPGLRKLNMMFCGTKNIPDHTFECTPLLSEIYFYYNLKLRNLTLNSLLPLKHLQFLNIRQTSLVCDCELYDTWLWLRQHHVHYITGGIGHERKPFCGNRDIDKVFSIMNCKKTREHTFVSRNVTVIRDEYQIFKRYIEPLVLIVILIFGLACNGFLLFISFRYSDMRTKQNALVINLALVDVLSLILNLSLSYWDTVNIIWEFDKTVCKIFILSKDMMTGVTVYSIVALSIERYLVAKTFKNFKKMCISEGPPTIWLLMMSWVSGIVMSLPAYFTAIVVDAQCLYCPSGNEEYIRSVWTFQIIMFCLIPALVIIFLNIKTSISLRESVRRIPGEIKNNIQAKNRKTVANIVLILVVVFIISYLPNYVLRVLVAWSVVDMERIFLPAFFTYCLFFFNTVFNPISLFLMSSKFKSHASHYFP